MCRVPAFAFANAILLASLPPMLVIFDMVVTVDTVVTVPRVCDAAIVVSLAIPELLTFVYAVATALFLRLGRLALLLV